MIICKRPAPPDDHLQEAAPSGGGAYGQRSTGHFTTLGRIVEEKEEEKEEEEEEEEKERKFLRADGQAHGPINGIRGPRLREEIKGNHLEAGINCRGLHSRICIINHCIPFCVLMMPVHFLSWG